LFFLRAAPAPAAPAAAAAVRASAPAAAVAVGRGFLLVAFAVGRVEVELLLDGGLALVVGDALLGRVREREGLDAGDLLAGEGEQGREVVGQVGEVEERVLLLADVDEGGPDAGHDRADAGEVDVAQRADVIRMLDVELYQLAILHDGDARAVLARVDDDFFLHVKGWGAPAHGFQPRAESGES